MDEDGQSSESKDVGGLPGDDGPRPERLRCHTRPLHKLHRHAEPGALSAAAEARQHHWDGNKASLAPEPRWLDGAGGSPKGLEQAA